MNTVSGVRPFKPEFPLDHEHRAKRFEVELVNQHDLARDTRARVLEDFSRKIEALVEEYAIRLLDAKTPDGKLAIVHHPAQIAVETLLATATHIAADLHVAMPSFREIMSNPACMEEAQRRSKDCAAESVAALDLKFIKVTPIKKENA